MRKTIACGVCGKEVRVTAAGLLERHREDGIKTACAGSADPVCQCGLAAGAFRVAVATLGGRKVKEVVLCRDCAATGAVVAVTSREAEEADAAPRTREDIRKALLKMTPESGFQVATPGERVAVSQEAAALRAAGKIAFDVRTRRSAGGGFEVTVAE